MTRPVGPDAGVSADNLIPLCVDLDDTLIRTDILWESVVQLWRRPLVALSALSALLLRGKAGLKTFLAAEIPIDPVTLPYRDDVLDFVKSQRANGRSVILATATHRIVAQRIADHLGIFSRVFATEAELNLSGARKQQALESAFGAHGFDYIGDSRKDLPIFAAARQALLVKPSRSLLALASVNGNVAHVFSEAPISIKTILRALRVHQWTKNVLLVVPLLSAHLVLDSQAWTGAFVAFLAFSLVASATYLVNDLVDLQSDRVHPKKRFRPLASGRLPIPVGIMMGALLGVLGLTLAQVLLPAGFVAYLGIYTALTLAYSLDLKRRLLVDVLTLAVLYTLRILAGGAAIGVLVSEWLLMFSLFIFLSLAFLKRAIELHGAVGGKRVSGRGYSPVDLETVRTIGVSSGLISVLILSLYINSPAVSQLYRSPQMLWFICPLLIYWISRIWFLAARSEIHHDPVVFALLDWRSYIVGACALVTVFLASIDLSRIL